MKKSLKVIYEEMRSLYGKGFGAYMNAFTLGSEILARPEFDEDTKKEILGLINEGTEKLERYYSSLPEDIIEQPHFDEIREIRTIIPDLLDKVRFVAENYRNSDAIPELKKYTEDITALSKEVSEKATSWRSKINEIGRQIGKDKDVWHYTEDR
ncbi:MAG: hypothetical protein J7K54_04490 [Candidatus Aenigmarchaeota archaeon]|nr:hypothetical protein [Candidatus Aenigmarchaeota archaeon]